MKAFQITNDNIKIVKYYKISVFFYAQKGNFLFRLLSIILHFSYIFISCDTRSKCIQEINIFSFSVSQQLTTPLISNLWWNPKIQFYIYPTKIHVHVWGEVTTSLAPCVASWVSDFGWQGEPVFDPVFNLLVLMRHADRGSCLRHLSTNHK